MLAHFCLELYLFLQYTETHTQTHTFTKNSNMVYIEFFKSPEPP